MQARCIRHQNGNFARGRENTTVRGVSSRHNPKQDVLKQEIEAKVALLKKNDLKKKVVISIWGLLIGCCMASSKMCP
jgi:hypothetical protein